MKPYRFPIVALLRSVFVLTPLILVSGSEVSAQGVRTPVAKPYPGAVPEQTNAGKQTRCGDNENTYCFLTRDPVEKVRAFYAREGIKLESIPAKALTKIGGGRSNFEQALRYQLEDRLIGTLLAAPVEFYQTKGADDTPSYFNAVAVMTGVQKVRLQEDDKGKQAVIDDEVLGPLALSPQTKPFVAIYGNIYLDPVQLIPHYNRHLAMLSGFFRNVDGNSVAHQKREEMRTRLITPAASGSNEDEMDTKRDAMRKELREIWARKPEKRRQYQMVEMKAAQMRGSGDKDARKKIQPELDQIMTSDPELAAWKKRSDALDQQAKQAREKEKGQQAGPGNRELRNEDVAAILEALEKEVYYTRILIHASEGRRVKHDAATVQAEWKSVVHSFGE